MLVISRKKNETLVIGPEVLVTVVEIRPDKVRLGVISPKDMPVHREEVYQALFGTAPGQRVPPAPPPVIPPAPVPPPGLMLHTPAAVPADVVTEHLDAVRRALAAAAADGVYIDLSPRV